MNHQIVYQGKKYKSISSLANVLRVKYTALLAFCKRHNYDLTYLIIEKGKLRTEPKQLKGHIVINGQAYRSMKNASESLNIDYEI